jgi:hypothetical protein
MRLVVVNVGEEEGKELARARGQATPRKLFDLTSQSSPFDLRRNSRPSLSSPLLPPNCSRRRREKRLADSDGRHSREL